ncbi:efflux RND transporter permease subunit [Aestuariibacter sp. AA17]|uniref:Efflux RND transporter permease subunit n=1 Tax=Fluctibacter corallii TaxID=2984329 RepID=A0ABT3A5F2_9ALTE|nr:efflux RND transporter permease subunit [Aestuariibacter sp. AA17]MCV2883923.1 efflux RND transporter permease subunit [Aestuariibacter sp. AA17]
MDKFAHSGAQLASFALRRPVTVCMFFFSLLIVGLGASRLLPLERFPGIEIPELYVNIPYYNATPAEVEKMITRPVEEALATMSGIKRLRSRSNEDSAEIMLEFAWGENIKAKSVEAREKIDAIRHLLPQDIERILVFKFNTNDMPIVQLRVSSQRDLSNAYDLLERNLKAPIERVKGVSRVTLYGVLKKEISIRLNAEKIAALHIDTAQLVQRLRAENFSMTAGSFYDQAQKITVNPDGEFRTKEEIGDVLITPSVRLRDIADIIYETPRRVEGRHLDQTYAVGLDIFRESGSNLVEVSKGVLNVVNDAKQNTAFNGINLFVMNDEADSVTSSLRDVLNAGLIGALLSIGVLYLFLRNITTTLIVVLSVPFSICITLACMYFMGYSLNILSLMGLMLAVGMLVDNAVVVTESIFHERETNADTIDATKKGVAKVSLAIIAGTATTAIVFLPNIVGVKVDITVFLEHVAVAICISLFASLLLAQTLIPLLATKVKRPPATKTQTKSAFYQRYGRTLTWMLRHQKKSVAIALAILVSTAVPISVVSSDDEGNNRADRLFINYHIQGSYSLEEVEEEVTRVENYLYDNQDAFHIEQVYSYYTPGRANSRIALKPDLPFSVSELKEKILENMPKLARSRPSFQWEEGNGGGVKITLLGNASETLMSISDNILPILRNIEGLEDVNTELDGTKFELQINVDRVKAYRFGLSAKDVADIVSVALRGSNLRTFRHGDTGEIGIKLLFDQDLQHSLEKMRQLTIIRDGTKNITLDMLADIKVAPRLSQIERSYRQTSLTIGANLSEDTTMEQARDRIESAMSHVNLPTGYSWTLDGGFQRQDEGQAIMITNMLLAICMIYVVMAALFESLLLPTSVITSLLFSFTGVFWAFFVTGTPMSVMGMIGMLILMGIVVNNGIVLVDRINQLIHQGSNLHDAIVNGCLDRIRPILMTVATTVLGLLPLALGNTQLGGDGPSYSPMAIAIIGGLIVSTLTSLFLVPLFYLLLLKLRHRTLTMVRTSRFMVRKVLP